MVNKEQRGSCDTCGVKSKGAGLVWKGGTEEKHWRNVGRIGGRGVNKNICKCHNETYYIVCLQKSNKNKRKQRRELAGGRREPDIAGQNEKGRTVGHGDK